MSDGHWPRHEFPSLEILAKVAQVTNLELETLAHTHGTWFPLGVHSQECQAVGSVRHLPETHWESGGERYPNGQPSTRCVCLAGLTVEVKVPVVSDLNFKPGCNRVEVGGFRLLMVAGVVIASTTPPGY